MSAAGPATLSSLRRVVAGIEKHHAGLESGRKTLSSGIADIDGALGGGLAFDTLHEVAAAGPSDLGAASGFVLALAARAGGNVLWIQQDQQDWADFDPSFGYGPGLDPFGLPSRHVLMMRLARSSDVMWAMEEALRSRALCVVIGELIYDALADDLKTSRRLVLAARESGSLAFLLRHRPPSAPSAAMTRWQVAPAPSEPDRFGGLGRTAFTLSLIKNRYGPAGEWRVAWDQHERIFSPLSLGVASASFDRPDRAPLARAG